MKDDFLNKIIECALEDKNALQKISTHTWDKGYVTNGCMLPKCIICGLDIFDLIYFDNNNKIKIKCKLSCGETLVKEIIE